MYNEWVDNLNTPCLNNGKSLSLLFFFFNFDHYHQNECQFFPFLEKTPFHQVILYNNEKHVEGSLFEANQMRL